MPGTVLANLNATLPRATTIQNYLPAVITCAMQTNPGSPLVDLLNQASDELDNLMERLQAAIQNVLNAYKNDGDLETLEDWERALNLFGISLTVGSGLDKTTEWGGATTETENAPGRHTLVFAKSLVRLPGNLPTKSKPVWMMNICSKP
jgi:hypothetical protein